MSHNQYDKNFNLDGGLIIGIGPLDIPEYLNRPQIVTLDKNDMLQIAQFDRWAEPLDIGLRRIIREDLTAILPEASLYIYPWNLSIPVQYQVAIEIIQMDSRMDTEMSILAQWMVMDPRNSKILVMKKFEFRQAVLPHNYAGLAKTLSAACLSLSNEIARVISSLGPGQ